MVKMLDKLFSYVVLPVAVILLVWGYLWGPSIYERSFAIPLDNQTPREQMVWKLAKQLKAKSTLAVMPEILATTSNKGSLSVSEPFAPGIIAVSTGILRDDSDFNESDVAAIIAHEIAHLESSDSYKFWKKFSADWQRDIEAAADRRAAALAGCVAVRSLFIRHYSKATQGWLNMSDPHPHPEDRIKAAGDCKP